MPVSDYTHPKIIEIFSFPEFAPEYKISVHSIYSFWRYNQLQSPMNKLATSIFGHAHPKMFLINHHQGSNKDFFTVIGLSFNLKHPMPEFQCIKEMLKVLRV